MRPTIRAEIEAIEPADSLEAAHQADALAWIDSGAELCRIAKPATPPKHLVSYFALVNDDHILLVDHKNSRLWLPSGGHVEPGEHPRETVLRELKEELGMAPDHAIDRPILVTCTETVGVTTRHVDVSLWYVIRARLDQAMTFDRQEFNAIQWFAFDDVPFERSDPHMRRFVQKLGTNGKRA